MESTVGEPTGKKPPPKCKAILLCDHVIEEAVTAKNSLIGVFKYFAFEAFLATRL